MKTSLCPAESAQTSHAYLFEMMLISTKGSPQAKSIEWRRKGQTHISLRPSDRTRAPLDRVSTELEVAQRIWRLAPGNPEFLHRGISRLFHDRIEVSCGLALYQLAAGDLKLPSCDRLAEDGVRFGGVYL